MKVLRVIFRDSTDKFKNDTEVALEETDLISGEGNGTGTDYDSWGAGWTLSN